MSAVPERETKVLVELGRTTLTVEAVKQLTCGSVVTLDASTTDPVDVYADGELVARGELLVRDEEFFVRVSEVCRQPPVS
jgi:flagellar motor switch protein FliN